MGEPGLPTGFKWWVFSTVVTIAMYCLLSVLMIGGFVIIGGWTVLEKLKIVNSNG